MNIENHEPLIVAVSSVDISLTIAKISLIIVSIHLERQLWIIYLLATVLYRDPLLTLLLRVDCKNQFAYPVIPQTANSSQGQESLLLHNKFQHPVFPECGIL